MTNPSWRNVWRNSWKELCCGSQGTMKKTYHAKWKGRMSWLFISGSYSCVQSCSSNSQQDVNRCWKLGLLIKNWMILGSAVPLGCFHAFNVNGFMLYVIFSVLLLYILNWTPFQLCQQFPFPITNYQFSILFTWCGSLQYFPLSSDMLAIGVAAWKYIWQAWKNGGLNFKDLRAWNTAQCCKWLWKLHFENSISVQYSTSSKWYVAYVGFEPTYSCVHTLLYLWANKLTRLLFGHCKHHLCKLVPKYSKKQHHF